MQTHRLHTSGYHLSPSLLAVIVGSCSYDYGHAYAFQPSPGIISQYHNVFMAPLVAATFF